MSTRNITNTNPIYKPEVVREASQKSNTPLKLRYGNQSDLPAKLDENTLYFAKRDFNEENDDTEGGWTGYTPRLDADDE